MQFAPHLSAFCEAYFFQLKFAILAKDFERMKQILSKKESAIFTNIFSKTLMSEWERQTDGESKLKIMALYREHLKEK